LAIIETIFAFFGDTPADFSKDSRVSPLSSNSNKLSHFTGSQIKEKFLTI
jgi:hypothetical protein